LLRVEERVGAPSLQIVLQQFVKLIMLLHAHVFVIPLLLIRKSRILRTNNTLESGNTYNGSLTLTFNQILIILFLQQIFIEYHQLLKRLIFIKDQCWEHEFLRVRADLELLNPVVEFLDQDLHIAVEAVILSEQLLLKPVQQRGIQGLNSLLVNYEHASKLIIDYAPAFVGPDSHIAEFK